MMKCSKNFVSVGISYEITSGYYLLFGAVMEIFNIYTAIIVVAICLTIRSVVVSKQRHELRMEALKRDKLDHLDYLEEA